MSDITPVEIVPRQIPTGEARRLRESANENWQERLLRFSPVQNKVLVVNPNINSPFNLEEGKPTPLGVFAQIGFTKKPVKLEGKRDLEVLPEQGRATLLGRVIFSDKDGHVYRDIDLKGIGYLDKRFMQTHYRPTVSKPGGVWGNSGGKKGLLDYDTAKYDYVSGEELSQAGVRTARTLAIIELQELILGGKTVSLFEARELGIIDKDFHPVIQVRAFGTNARIRDLADPEDRVSTKKFGLLDAPHILAYEKTSDLLLEDAKKLVAQELGKDSISNDEYLEWFAQTLGRNVGLIHKQGVLHGFLHDQNITLDCRIVDFDGETEISSRNDYEIEMDTIKDTLGDLYLRVNKSTKWGIDETRNIFLWQAFQQSYNSVFKPRMLQKFLRKAKVIA